MLKLIDRLNSNFNWSNIYVVSRLKPTKDIVLKRIYTTMNRCAIVKNIMRLAPCFSMVKKANELKNIVCFSRLPS